MDFVANFQKVQGHLFRFDTRIYLQAFSSAERGECVGAIIGKNPGSARPVHLDQLAKLRLNGDRMLPFVGNRFKDAYRMAGKSIPTNAYIRVWNLFYLCDHNLGQAIRIALSLPSLPLCPSEAEVAPVVWFGWGGDDRRLNPFKTRFQRKEYWHPFYYDHKARSVFNHVPSKTDFAKHTQGLPASPVTEYLACIL